MHLFIRLALMLLLFTSAFALPAAAQSSGSGSESAQTLPEPLSTEAINQMVARMSDDEVRKMLLDRLDAVAAGETPQAQPKGVIATISDVSTQFGLLLLRAVKGLPNMINQEVTAISNFVADFGGAGLGRLFGVIAASLAVGFAIEYLVTFATRRWQGAEASPDTRTLWTSLKYLFRRFLRELLGLVGFYIGVRTTAVLLVTPQEAAFVAPFLTYLIWIPRIGAAVSRFILTPDRPELRLVKIDDHGARYLHRNLIGLFLLAGFAVFIVRFNAGNGVPMGQSQIGFWLNTAVHVYIAIIAWRARRGLTQMMLGDDPDRTRSDVRVAEMYPYFAIAVSALMWLIVGIIVATGNQQILATAPHYVTMFWLLAAPVLDTVIRALVRHLLPPMMGDGPVAERAYKATKRSYIRIGRVLVAGIVLLLIASAWNVNLFELSRKGSTDLGAGFFQFLLTLAIGYVVFEAVSLWINRRLAREQTSRLQTTDQVQGEGGGAGGSRLATVLPLLRITAQAAIAVVFALLALGSLGIDITPLLAGAGVLGLAIGFGAQKLVSDVVSGVFFLIDDAFRMGEYVDVGGTTGTVERISIRSMQLRHHRGLVHTIPYGEISKLTNFSRDWVIMKLKFTVPFDTDPNTVKKIFKKIGNEMMADEMFKDGFLEPFKSQGVFDFSDVGMVIRGKFMAKPGEQFTIRKEIYNRVKDEFKAAGIEFARPEVRVAMPHDDDVSDEERAAIETAAKAAVRNHLAKKEE